MRALLVTAVLLLMAGCIAPPEPPTSSTTTTAGPEEMTAKETRDQSAALCTDGIDLSNDNRFCATRTITVDGTISGIGKLEVDVGTFNGGVAFAPAPEGQWGFTATLKARGATAEDALANLDDIQFEWSHVSGSAHFLHALAKKEGSGNGYAAAFDVTLPPSITYVLAAQTSNGVVKVAGLRTDSLSAQTSNGMVDVDAAVTNVQLATSNGEIHAKLDPVGSGRLTLTTSNGRVDLALPEDARRGYEVEGTTSNGEVEIRLRDGRVGDCPQGSQYYTPPCSHRTFQTSGFAGRAVQSRVVVTTSNGDVAVGPS
jgi:Putative adhesin